MHNHLTRDLKPPGICPECDLHYIPQGLRAVRPDGETVPVLATYGGVTKGGEHEWVVVSPAGPIVAFEADTGPGEGHVLSFVSPEYAAEQAGFKMSGPESGPSDEGARDE